MRSFVTWLICCSQCCVYVDRLSGIPITSLPPLSMYTISGICWMTSNVPLQNHQWTWLKVIILFWLKRWFLHKLKRKQERSIAQLKCLYFSLYLLSSNKKLLPTRFKSATFETQTIHIAATYDQWSIWSSSHFMMCNVQKRLYHNSDELNE